MHTFLNSTASNPVADKKFINSVESIYSRLIAMLHDELSINKLKQWEEYL